LHFRKFTLSEPNVLSCGILRAHAVVQQDPLGVAVQQTFGVGLGYNFNHMGNLEEGEQPSLRRLQARAAKSAIRRVQELYNSEAATKELNSISDPDERGKKALDMRKRTDEEIQHLAKRLTELVPSGMSGEFEDTTRIQQLRQKSNFVKTSSHEYVLRNDPPENMSSAESIFEDLTVMNSKVIEPTEADETPSANEEDSSIQEPPQQKRKDENGVDDTVSNSDKDDEFLQAYISQQDTLRADVDEDDEDTTILLA
jgi:hypothetical protein